MLTKRRTASPAPSLRVFSSLATSGKSISSSSSLSSPGLQRATSLYSRHQSKGALVKPKGNGCRGTYHAHRHSRNAHPYRIRALSELGQSLSPSSILLWNGAPTTSSLCKLLAATGFCKLSAGGIPLHGAYLFAFF